MSKKTAGQETAGQEALITQNDLDEYEKYSRVVGNYEEKILNRITVVLSRIFKEFGAELNNWYFDGAFEGEVGNLHSPRTERRQTLVNLGKEVSSYYTETKGPCNGVEMLARLKNGDLVEFGSSFPSRWLYQDFEKELVEGKARFDKEELEKKSKAASKRAANKAAKEKAIATAVAKLTKAERKALGL